MSNEEERWPRPVLEALAGALIGSTLLIRKAPGLASVPLEGTVIDETLETFLLRIPGRSRPRRISKTGLEGTVYLRDRELPLRGELLRMRPEDRTKRLLIGHSRRSA
jgi:RNase P/RNase MRP subunit p29